MHKKASASRRSLVCSSSAAPPLAFLLGIISLLLVSFAASITATAADGGVPVGFRCCLQLDGDTFQIFYEPLKPDSVSLNFAMAARVPPDSYLAFGPAQPGSDGSMVRGEEKICCFLFNSNNCVTEQKTISPSPPLATNSQINLLRLGGIHAIALRRQRSRRHSSADRRRRGCWRGALRRDTVGCRYVDALL